MPPSIGDAGHKLPLARAGPGFSKLVNRAIKTSTRPCDLPESQAGCPTESLRSCALVRKDSADGAPTGTHVADRLRAGHPQPCLVYRGSPDRNLTFSGIDATTYCALRTQWANHVMAGEDPPGRARGSDFFKKLFVAFEH